MSDFPARASAVVIGGGIVGNSLAGWLCELGRRSEVRAVLEAEAARLAAERATDAERTELRGLIAEIGGDLDDRGLMELDERIHRAVYRCAHNDLLEDTLERYYMLALRIWMIALDRQHELKDAVGEHRTLLEAIHDGDAARAAETMRGHVEDFEQAMHRVLLSV